jgi:hypothetical protein
LRNRGDGVEAHDVVQDVSDEKAPPDDEGKDQGQGGGGRLGGFVGILLLPTNPVGRRQRQPDGDEMLLKIEESKGLPMAGALQSRSNGNAETQVHDSTQQRAHRIQNDDRVGE